MNHDTFINDVFGSILPTNSISARVVCVSPEHAETLLNLNYNRNRTVRNNHVEKFKRALETDFFVDGSALRLNYFKGVYTLTDGQHRLQAIAESGKAATMVVIISDSDPSADYAKVDQIVRRRTDTDALDAIAPNENGLSVNARRSYHSALRLIHLNFVIGAKVTPPLPIDILDLAKEYSAQIDFMDEILTDRISGQPTKRGVWCSAPLAVALVTAKYANPEIVKDFWGQVQADDGLRANDPRKKLHLYLMADSADSGGQGRYGAIIASVKCWNAFVAGITLDKIYASGAVPKIALTPFPPKRPNA